MIAEFDISDNRTVQKWLKEQQFALDEPLCVLKRQLYRDKPSKSFINDQPVTASVLNQLGEQLVNICGQQEHLNLIKPATRLAIVDAHAQTKDLLIKLISIYKQLIETNREIEQLEKAQNDTEDQSDLLNFLIAELEQGNFSASDYQELDATQKRLSHNSDIVQSVSTCLALLNESSTSSSITALLGQSVKHLTDSIKYEPRLKNTLEALNSASIACEEAASELSHLFQDLESDPTQLEDVEQKLSNYHTLARKHRCEPIDLDKKLLSLQQRMEFIENSDQQISRLREKQNKFHQQYNQLANRISDKRKKTAKSLSKSITNQLQSLNLKGARCEIEVRTDAQSIHPNGQDTIQILISTNSGQPLGPIEKIASGGELSRIGMAIALETSLQSGNAVLIFDEVDTGISGKTADVVGDKLKNLAENNQTICITHLPQVACKAQHQLMVSKDNKQKSKINLEYLDNEARVIELARFLSGKQITDESLANARVMLKEAIK